MTADASAPRQPRAYIRRRGRLTAGQSRALDQLDRFLLDPAETGELDLPAIYGRAAPVGLEIGFGMGQALLDWGEQCPDWNLLGLEIYEPGVGSALLGCERLGLTNIRVMQAAAETVLDTRILPSSLDEVRIFFPDPWPKKRHFKRRLIQPAFAALLAERIRPGGLLWLATDWDPYAEWMLDILAGEPRFVCAAHVTRGVERAIQEPGRTHADSDADAGEAAARQRIQTRFEARGLRLGHSINDLCYRRVG